MIGNWGGEEVSTQVLPIPSSPQGPMAHGPKGPLPHLSIPLLPSLEMRKNLLNVNWHITSFFLEGGAGCACVHKKQQFLVYIRRFLANKSTVLIITPLLLPFPAWAEKQKGDPHPSSPLSELQSMLGSNLPNTKISVSSIPFSPARLFPWLLI